MSTKQPKSTRRGRKPVNDVGGSESTATKARVRRARTTATADKKTKAAAETVSRRPRQRTKKQSTVAAAEPLTIEVLSQAASNAAVVEQSSSAATTTRRRRTTSRSQTIAAQSSPISIESGVRPDPTNPLIPVETRLQGASTVLGETVVPRQVTQPTQSILPLIAIKIKEIVARVRDITTDVIQDKVIIQGIIHKQLFFVGNDMIVHHLAEDVPFSTFVDVPGARTGNNVFVRAEIEGVLFRLAPDGITVDQKVVVQLFVKVTETVQVNVVQGAGPLVMVEEVVGENTGQTLLENQITLNAPSVKVSEIQATVRDVTAEVIPDKVIIQGIVHKQIFFVGTDGLERHQAEDVRFSAFVDVPGAAAGMNVQVHPQVETVLFELLSPLELLQKVVLAFFVKVTQTVQIRVTEDAGPLLRLAGVIGENAEQVLVESVATLPRQAIKVREIVSQIRDVVAKVVLNKIIVQGVLHKQIFFIGVDNIEYHQAEDVPFSLFMDIPGATAGMDVTVNTVIEGIFFELIAPTQVLQKVIIQVFAKVTQELQLRVATGSGPLIKVEQVVGENVTQILVRAVVQIVSPVTPTPTVSPVLVETIQVVIPGQQVAVTQQALVENTVVLPVRAVKIRAVTGTIEGLEAQVVPGGILVNGIVRKSVDFVDVNDMVRNVQEDVPFSVLIPIPDITTTEPVELRVDLENISFTLSDDGLALNQIIVIRATALRSAGQPQVVTVVTRAEGPGVNTTSLTVQGLVLRDTVPQLEQLNVVTDAQGPGVAAVQRDVIPLVVVGSGNPQPVPVEVVTGITFA